MKEAEALAFIERAPWRFAKTMPQVPHWYTLRKQNSDVDFDGFVVHIRKFGDLGRWGARYVHYYLSVGEWQYWTMGAPVPETILINRQRLSDSKVRYTCNGLSTQDRTIVNRWAANEPCQACRSIGLQVEWRPEHGILVPYMICNACSIEGRCRPGRRGHGS